MGKKQQQDKHSGSSFEDFLQEESMLAEVQALAMKRVIAWQFQQAMREQQLSKRKMAEQLRTSRSQLDRLLDPSNAAVSLQTIARAARILGKRIRIEVENLVPREKRPRAAKSILRGRALPRAVAKAS